MLHGGGAGADRAAALIAVANRSGMVSAWMWVLLIAMGALCLGSIYIFLRASEQKPDLATRHQGVSASHANDSLTSLSSAGAPTGPSPRGPPAGKNKTTKIRHGGSGAGSRCGSGPELDAVRSSVVCSSVASAPSGGSLFAVPLDALASAAKGGGFSMADAFGCQTLRALVSHNPFGARKVQLFSSEDAATPCISAEPPPPSQAKAGSFELFDVDGQRCGSVASQSQGSLVVLAEGQPQLIIDGSGPGWNMRISSRDGRARATISHIEDRPGEPGHIEIHVLPGLDPVLIVICSLAVCLFSGDDPQGGLKWPTHRLDDTQNLVEFGT
mmetsp:Transcript_107102/g.279657  ORF Transcript_107102/g.279657 Transcript_107102/m.279657 type:complete len:327 (+) Transcript_107102:94-1074(+)